MIKTRCALFIIPALLLVTAPGMQGSFSGTPETSEKIAPVLDRILQNCPSDSVVSVIVKLERSIRAKALRSKLEVEGVGRNEVHRILMEKLRTDHGEAQENFINRLPQRVDTGAIRRVRRFWISNLVVLDIEASEIVRIAGLPDVESIVLNRTLHLSGNKGRRAPEKVGTGWNIWKIKAPSLWDSGYTGRGVLVCLIDSGVDGTHPALKAKWKGYNVPGSSASWHDPYNFSSFPVDDDVSVGPTHGTSVTGIMLGSEGGDTVGVAPGAHWIAANAFEGSSQSSTFDIILDCLEWAADPDGNPATTSDVPDVVNNSWGTNKEDRTGLCQDLLWDAIDAVEALGPMVFFAAGNYGPNSMTISSPASRIASDVNTFAVGATDESDEIASFSSRGPSTCDSVTVKPEVVAPGVFIRSSRGIAAGGGYQDGQEGTSFATPHVSGLAALLKQMSSTSGGDEIKRAILNSANDLGEAGEDNAYGSGLVDAVAAAGHLSGPTSSVLRLTHLDPAPLILTRGDTMEVVATVFNMGRMASDVRLELSEPTGIVEMIDGSSSLGDIISNEESSNTSDPFVLFTQAGATRGSEVLLGLTVSSSDFEEEVTLQAFVGEETTAGYVTHDAGDITFTVTNFGQYGYYNHANLVGSGFVFPRGGENWLFQGFFLAGTGENAVSDGLGNIDTDWRPADGGNIYILRSGGRADEEGRAQFDDSISSSPLPVHVFQRSYAFSDPDKEDFIVFEYLLKNEGTTVLDNLYTGLYFDWDIDSYSYDGNEVGWIDTLSLGYMYDRRFEEHFGISLLEGPVASHRAIKREEIYDDFGYSTFTDRKKWNFLTAGFEQSASSDTSDWSHMLSAGPISIQPGDSVELAFSVIAAMGMEDLIQNTEKSIEVWEQIKTNPPPTFVISVLADAILSEYLTISAVPSEALAGEPVLTVDGDTLSLDFITTSDPGVYRTEYLVQSEGDHLVSVYGVDQDGVSGTSLEWFTALHVSPGAGGSMWSRDGNFSFSFENGTVEREGFIYLTYSERPAPALPQGMVPISDSYSIIPSGLQLKCPATVSFRVKDMVEENSADSLKILVYSGGEWLEYTASHFSEDKVGARISSLGIFVLATDTRVPGAPGKYMLSQNFPNPFNPQTTIPFDVPEGSEDAAVKITIFNLRGQLVKTLFHGEKSPGRYEVVWDGRDFRGDEVGSGMYFCTMTVNGFTQTRKMVLLK